VNAIAGGWLLALVVASLPPPPVHSSSHRPEGPNPPRERGMALGLFSADPTYRYRDLLKEIRELGATHVAVVWVWWQEDVHAVEIAPHPGWSATDAQILETLRAAADLGLSVTAFPIVRLMSGDPKQWRGRIAPEDEDRWWAAYETFILHAAVAAQSAGVDRLCIGSELLSREHQRQRWLHLIDRLRLRAPDMELLYSANWDHYEAVSFWDAVDVVGLTAYWELTRDADASKAELVAAWGPVRRALRAWSGRMQRPFIFTEVGYPSLDGGAMFPWNETRTANVDQEEQRRAYQAFMEAWDGAKELEGVYFWNWFGFGGPSDGNYTPRGKPAAEVVRSWYRGATQPGHASGPSPSPPPR
jgi:hypothetical protein